MWRGVKTWTGQFAFIDREMHSPAMEPGPTWLNSPLVGHLLFSSRLAIPGARHSLSNSSRSIYSAGER
jgi:hypothetical protein